MLAQVFVFVHWQLKDFFWRATKPDPADLIAKSVNQLPSAPS